MHHAPHSSWPAHGGGLFFPGRAAARSDATWRRLQSWLRGLGLDGCAVRSPVASDGSAGLRLHVPDDLARQWAPGWDTTALARTLALETAHNPADLEREIALALMLGPMPAVFPSVDELVSAVRMRRYIAEAGRRTALSFHTEQAERPPVFWRYDEDNGFTLVPGRRLVDALRAATQPDATGRLYSFSCYRATEYVILLGIAQELAQANPALLAQLERQCERRAIRSGEFHAVFLREQGTLQTPLPPRYYVPGDRVWLRNPDQRSSDVTGYEGAWIIYLGGGEFTNFWRRGRPHTLNSKCLEIFHWRNALGTDAQGAPRIDEAEVERQVLRTAQQPQEAATILQAMLRLRGPQGSYGQGGCIAATREAPRWVRPGTLDMVLPTA